jgi:hypothetical protein
MEYDPITRKLQENWSKLSESGNKVTKADHDALLKKALAAQGTYTMPSIDKERYTEIPGLEGPFQSKFGHVYYYDPKSGMYYDRDKDMYIGNDELADYGIM